MDTKERNRLYYQKNKKEILEKRILQRKENPEHEKQIRKKHYENNKEIIKLKSKIYRNNNIEKVREYDNARPRRIQTERARFITRWKSAGIKCVDWDYVVDKYMSIENCETCDCILNRDCKTNKRICLDHCHKTGYVRNIVCHKCNMTFGKIDSIKNKVLLELHRYFILIN